MAKEKHERLRKRIPTEPDSTSRNTYPEGGLSGFKGLRQKFLGFYSLIDREMAFSGSVLGELTCQSESPSQTGILLDRSTFITECTLK